MRHETERCSLVKERVLALFLLALLPCRENGLATAIRKQNGAAVARLKVIRTQLPAVEQRQRQAVGQHRPEFFHEVECKAWPARTFAMQKTDRRVEAHAFDGTAAIVGQ